jgi:type VI secretion system protein ImpH
VNPDLPEADAQAAPPAQASGRVLADVLREMSAAPHQYDFFHAMRLIEALQPDKPRLGQARRPVD